jgi:hypothetical protein
MQKFRVISEGQEVPDFLETKLQAPAQGQAEGPPSSTPGPSAGPQIHHNRPVAVAQLGSGKPLPEHEGLWISEGEFSATEPVPQ